MDRGLAMSHMHELQKMINHWSLSGNSGSEEVTYLLGRAVRQIGRVMEIDHATDEQGSQDHERNEESIRGGQGGEGVLRLGEQGEHRGSSQGGVEPEEPPQSTA